LLIWWQQQRRRRRQQVCNLWQRFLQPGMLALLLAWLGVVLLLPLHLLAQAAAAASRYLQHTAHNTSRHCKKNCLLGGVRSSSIRHPHSIR
jgi:hypothetical protein